MSGPCDGLRVVDFSTWMAGPLATMVLADNGADVIKVEPPEGDPARDLPAFQTWNRGKQSAVLDLKTDAGREQALRLITGADAVVASFRVGVAERLGIGYEQARAVNPTVIYAAISGYGEHERFRELKGYEALVAAKSGRMMMFEGIADRPGPAYPAVPCASFSTAMLIVQGVLAALRHRRETGAGQKVSVSLLAALMPYDMVQWIAPQIAGVDATTAERASTKGLYNQPRAGAAGPLGTAAPAGRSYNPQQVHRPDFRVPRPNYLPAVTKDGVWLQFANTADHLWLAQMQAMELVELYGEERFAKMPSVATESDSEALWELVLERVRSKTYEEWARIFDGNENVAVDRFLTPLEAIEHRQVQHNGHVVSVPGLDGAATRQPGSLARYSESEVRIERGAPGLGEHTQEVLAQGAVPPSAAAARDGRAAVTQGGPLAGVTVIDFATFFAAPYATSLLANLGARVIKVEALGGDYSRYSAGGLLAFPTTQGKESIAVDLKHPEGRAIVHRLIERADLLLHNFRPGVPERLGIDDETCRKLNPGLVYLYGASYGDSGPDASRPAFHPIAGAIAGNAMRQAGAGHPPPNSQDLPIEELKREAWRMLAANEANPDVNAAIAAATALLLGMRARDESGHGQSLMTTMIASNMYSNSDDLIAYEGRPAPRQVDGELLGVGPLYRLYETSEGWVFLACLRRREWAAFCRMIEQPDLESSWEAGWGAAESPKASELASTIADALQARSAGEWERLAREHDVPLVAVESRDPARFCLEDESMREQGYFVEACGPVYGSYRRHGSPVQFSAHELSYGPWEPVGGHTRSILSELGYEDGETDRLVAEGVVEAWSAEGA
jgi:crotonobetainyl-CoA:carnitine CoA-transferase CaiB-like acyl-CoA transferase